MTEDSTGPHGIVLLDKPLGLSSNRALQQVKRLFHAHRAGHTGSLDPLATGMLPICLGEATKVAGLLLASRKAYRAEVRLGSTTTTADAEGQIVLQRPVPEFDDSRLEQLLATFRGRIRQRPPAYSAIKQGGEPLYRKARRGEAVVVPEREVDIYQLRCSARSAYELRIEVECGSGTYIRSLAVDLGEALGCGAHLSALRRLWVEPFEHHAMVSAEQLEAAVASGKTAGVMLPIDAGLSRLPEVRLEPAEWALVRHGRECVRAAEPWTGICRLYDDAGRLAALGMREADGRVRPKRLFVFD
jgi:tRNA pseudouridine55 synthase